MSFEENFELLGFSVSFRGISQLANKLDSIQKISRPRVVSELRSFIRLVKRYKLFLLNLFDLVYPLNKLLRKVISFEWSPD